MGQLGTRGSSCAGCLGQSLEAGLPQSMLTQPRGRPWLCRWVAYGYVISDVMVYWPNQIGMLLGLFMTLSCYSLADTKVGEKPTCLRR